MKYALAFVALPLLVAVPCVAQAAKDAYDRAYRQLEAGDCAAALRSVEAAHRAVGPNPRVESLRAICHQAQNDPVSAKLALDRYLRLVPPAVVGSDHHKAMLALAQSVDADLQAEERRFVEERNQERLRAAETAVAAAKARFEATRERADSERSRRLYNVYSASSDKKAFDDALKNALDGPALRRTRASFAAGAQTVANQAADSINGALGDMVGRMLPFHVFPDSATRAAAPFKLEHIKLSGKVIDFKAEGLADRRVTLRESGTYQGFDLTKLKSYTTEAGADGAVVHRFVFSEASIWRRGTARFSDGKYFAGEIASSQGSEVLRIQVPAEISDRIKDQFAELIAAAQRAKQVR